MNLSISKFRVARPVDANAAETRRAILRAAVATFGEVGFDGATVRNIADVAGISFATVHHYFGTKEALYDACLDASFAELDEMGAAVTRAVLDAPPGEGIRAGIRAAYGSARAHPDRSRFLLRSFLFERRPRVRERHDAAQRALVTSSAALLGDDAAFGRRVPLVALGVLLTRFAVSAETERALFAEETGDADEAVVAYLVAVAEATLHVPTREVS